MISSNSSECRFSNGKHLLWCYDTSYINNTIDLPYEAYRKINICLFSVSDTTFAEPGTNVTH